MLFSEMVRFTAQQRALYCYLLLSVWIFLLIAGMYKYIGGPENSLPISISFPRELHKDFKDNRKTKKIFQACNPMEDIARGNEGGISDEWSLQGVIVLIRHGDRGPMGHVRGINNVNCGLESDPPLNKYVSALSNWTHLVWPHSGPFHGFPLLPATPTSCQLGQLTHKGIAQLLKVGAILKEVYSKSLNLPPTESENSPTADNKQDTTASAQPASAPEDTRRTQTTRVLNNASSVTNTNNWVNQGGIVVISTKYRRTFQSAMALMFSVLPTHLWSTLNVVESQSLAFCFTECACSKAEHHRRQLSLETSSHLKAHPAVKDIVTSLGRSLLEGGTLQASAVRDALLALLCHGAPLPCQKRRRGEPSVYKRRGRSIQSLASDGNAQNEVINIDQENDQANPILKPMLPTIQSNDFSDIYNENEEIKPKSLCIEKDHVASLFSYLHWDMKKQLKSTNMKRACVLKAYGLIKNIVQQMLSMVSHKKPKLVLYSGHDKTLQYISVALGFGSDAPFVPYASRLVFEVYQNININKNINTQINLLANEYYFRVLYNGKDFTKQLPFCTVEKRISIAANSKTQNNHENNINTSPVTAYLCPIELIVRFIHEDYFLSLNATNFKDACFSH